VNPKPPALERALYPQHLPQAIYTRRAAHKNVTAVYDLIETKERLLIIFELVRLLIITIYGRMCYK